MEPVIKEPVPSKTIGPPIRLAPTSTQQPRTTPLLLSPSTPDPIRPKPAINPDNEYEEIGPPSPKPLQDTASLIPKLGWQTNGTSGKNSPALPAGNTPHSTDSQHFTFNVAGSEDGSASLSQKSGEVKQSFIQPAEEIESVYVTSSEVDTGEEDDLDHTYDEPQLREELQVMSDRGSSSASQNAQEYTEPVSASVSHISVDSGAQYAVVNKKKLIASAESPDKTDGESKPTPPQGTTRYTDNSAGSSSSSFQPVSHSGTSSASNTPTSVLKSPKDIKDEQLEELGQLPSIRQKKQALEQKLKGEDTEEQKRPVKKAPPPPVPKRMIFPNNSTTDSKELKEETDDPETEAADTKPSNKALTSITEPIKSSIKNTPPRTPKRLSIPDSFQHAAEDDETKSPQKISPSSIPKRITIPESLQLRPPPPPMSTHPGLAKKEEERQNLQVEQEKPQPQKSKKRLSFLRKKGKDKEKDKDKHKSSTKDEPVLLEDVEKLKQMQQQQQQESLDPVTTPVSENPRPRRLSGVPTPAMSPISLDKSGGGAELESMFKVITKQEWQPENEKSQDADAITVSTFGKPSIKVSSASPEKVPDKTEQKEPKKTVDSPDDIGVSTFKPKGVFTASPAQHQKTPNASPLPTSKSSLPASPTNVLHSPNISGHSIVTQQVPTTTTASPSTDVNNKPLVTQTADQSNTQPSIFTFPVSNEVASPTTSVVKQTTSPQPTNTTPKSIQKRYHSASVTGVVIVPSGGTPVTSSQLGPKTQSLVDVVPGLSKTTRTLPRTLPTTFENQASTSQGRNEIDFSQMVPGVRVQTAGSATERRHTTSGSKPEGQSHNKQVNSIGPMNTRRSTNITKKKSGIFSKNK